LANALGIICDNETKVDGLKISPLDVQNKIDMFGDCRWRQVYWRKRIKQPNA
jgi:hypothetical protein